MVRQVQFSSVDDTEVVTEDPPKPIVPRDLGDRAAKGAFLVVIMRWTIRGIGFLTIVILARILTPADFGFHGMAMAVVGLAEVLAQHGLGAAVVRHPSPTRSHYDTAWTISLAFHTVIAALVFIGCSSRMATVSD